MRRALPSIPLLCVLLIGAGALAHGPSVRLSYGRVAPAKLAIRAGQTVHFQNASATPRSFTLRSEDGSFESPTLSRGEGWHHEFAQAGSFAYHVVEFPDLRGVVIVAPAEPEP